MIKRDSESLYIDCEIIPNNSKLLCLNDFIDGPYELWKSTVNSMPITRLIIDDFNLFVRRGYKPRLYREENIEPGVFHKLIVDIHSPITFHMVNELGFCTKKLFTETVTYTTFYSYTRNEHLNIFDRSFKHYFEFKVNTTHYRCRMFQNMIPDWDEVKKYINREGNITDMKLLWCNTNTYSVCF